MNWLIKQLFISGSSVKQYCIPNETVFPYETHAFDKYIYKSPRQPLTKCYMNPVV